MSSGELIREYEVDTDDLEITGFTVAAKLNRGMLRCLLGVTESLLGILLLKESNYAKRVVTAVTAPESTPGSHAHMPADLLKH